MWCKQCQQDVPAVSSPDAGAYCCPRCAATLTGQAVPAERGEEATHRIGAIADLDLGPMLIDPLPDPVSTTVEELTAAGGQTVGNEVDLPPRLDSWEMDEELRHIHRVLAPQAPPAATAPTLGPFTPTRLDAAHVGRLRWNYPAMRQLIGQRLSSRTPAGWLAALVSFVLSIGLMAFAFGGVLLTWSLFTGRQDLWTIGMPIALVGQIVLLMGFILQMDRLWSDNRDTAAKLEHVDERLHDLKATADLLENSQGAPPASFFAHVPGTINSQMILADLKSQLDLLALKMGHDDRAR